MKKRMIHLAIGAFVIQSSVQADIAYNMTIAATASYSDPTLRERDENGTVLSGGDLVFENEWTTTRAPITTENYEYGSKITVERLTNREILEELIVNAEHDVSIRGWSLKLATPREYEDYDDSNAVPYMFAVKGDEVIPIVTVFEDDEEEAYADAGNYTYATSYNDNTGADTERESGSERFLTPVSVEIQIGDYSLDFDTILNGSTKLQFFEIGGYRLSEWVASSLAFTSIVGNAEQQYTDAESSENGSAVLQGNIRASGGKPLNFFPPPVNPPPFVIDDGPFNSSVK